VHANATFRSDAFHLARGTDNEMHEMDGFRSAGLRAPAATTVDARAAPVPAGRPSKALRARFPARIDGYRPASSRATNRRPISSSSTDRSMASGATAARTRLLVPCRLQLLRRPPGVQAADW
jgi:hypothetical protein